MDVLQRPRNRTHTAKPRNARCCRCCCSCFGRASAGAGRSPQRTILAVGCATAPVRTYPPPASRHGSTTRGSQIIHFVVQPERHVDLAVGIGLHPLLGQHHLALRRHCFDPEAAIRRVLATSCSMYWPARVRRPFWVIMCLAHARARALERIQRCIHRDATAQIVVAVQLDAVVAVDQQRTPVAVGRAVLERGAAIDIARVLSGSASSNWREVFSRYTDFRPQSLSYSSSTGGCCCRPTTTWSSPSILSSRVGSPSHSERAKARYCGNLGAITLAHTGAGRALRVDQ